MLKNRLKINDKTVLGIIIILLWSSHLPSMYPTPFQNKKGIKLLAKEVYEVPDWIKKEAGYKEQTQQELENSMMNELIFTWFKWLFMILIGILSGFLIIRRKPFGYILAVICFAFFIIFPQLYYLIKYGPSSFIRVLQASLAGKHYTIFFRIIHGDIVFVISLIIFIYLILPSTVRKFTAINGIRKPANANGQLNLKSEI